MSKRLFYTLTVGPLVLAVATLGALPLLGMQEEDERHTTRIHIERTGDGEGEAESSHRVIFVSEDGVTREIEGEGGDFSWTSEEGGLHLRRMMRHAMPHFALGEGAFLGVDTTRMTTDLRAHFGAPEDAGVLISQVVDDSAAFRAGLLVGDIITGVDGNSIGSSMDLLRAIREHDEGDSITIEIYRDGKAQNISALLGKSESLMRSFSGFPRGMKIDCDSGGGDCDIFMSRHLDACNGDEECNINISCDDGDCSCTVNGEDTDCDELNGIHVMPDD